jgi:hypothetical protein
MKNIILSFMFGAILSLAFSPKIISYIKENIDMSYGVQCTLGADQCLQALEEIGGAE